MQGQFYDSTQCSGSFTTVHKGSFTQGLHAGRAVAGGPIPDRRNWLVVVNRNWLVVVNRNWLVVVNRNWLVVVNRNWLVVVNRNWLVVVNRNWLVVVK